MESSLMEPNVRFQIQKKNIKSISTFEERLCYPQNTEVKTGTKKSKYNLQETWANTGPTGPTDTGIDES